MRVNRGKQSKRVCYLEHNGTYRSPQDDSRWPKKGIMSMSDRNVIPAASAAVTERRARKCRGSMQTCYVQYTQYLKFSTVSAWWRLQVGIARATFWRQNRDRDRSWSKSGVSPMNRECNNLFYMLLYITTYIL